MQTLRENTPSPILPICCNHLNHFLFFCFFFLPFTSACKRTCGNWKLPFPFGFSRECEIPLVCNNGNYLTIGKFNIRNISLDSIIVDLPESCNRSVKGIGSLWSDKYAPTWKNAFLLGGCNKDNECDPPEVLLRRRFGSENCTHGNGNYSCLSKEMDGLMPSNVLPSDRCRYLLSSYSFDSSKQPLVSLDLQTVELGWWLEGSCSGTKPPPCSGNARCTEVSGTPHGRLGYRCACADGFEGDPYQKDTGCRKVSTNCSGSKYVSRRCVRNNGIGILVGGIIGGASLMAIIAVSCCLIKKRFRVSRTQNNIKRLLSEAVGTVPFYHYRDIEKATNVFSEKNRIGTGAYGTVYAGKFHNGEQVAVKRIRNCGNEGFEQVMNEIKLLSLVSHANLVRILGCCIERGEQILVYEFMSNGTLAEHLQGERGSGLPWAVRLSIAADTAKAIAHLHSAVNPPIYHRDIKSSNILLDYYFNSKLADFGLSRMVMTESSHISTAPQGTPGYLDPQYHQNFHLSDKSDVYSFGVVLVEIITAKKAVDFSREQGEVNLAALAIDKIGKGCVNEIIDPFLEPHLDAWALSSIHKVAELAFQCLAFHRDMRPSMMEVAVELERIRRSSWSQMNDNFLMGPAMSSSSSASNRDEISQPAKRKVSMESRRVMVPQRCECEVFVEKECSPISMQDPWFSEQSSPSSDSLLDNVVQPQ